MPIKAVCQCGQGFSAKDELLGKRIRCPKCGAAVLIGPATVAAVPAASYPPRAAAPTAPEPEFPWENDFGPSASKPAAGTPSPIKSAHAPGTASPRNWIVADTGLAICFVALIVGGGAFAIISIAVIAIVSDSSALPNLMGGGAMGVIVTSLGLAWFGSAFSLATGWFVCCSVPRDTKTRPFIQAALVSVGVSVGLVLLLQLIVQAAVSPLPSPGSLPRNPADWRKFSEETARMEKDRAANANTMAMLGKTMMWLSALAAVASSAAFAFFLGSLAEYLKSGQIKMMALYFCILQGAFALWITLNMFVIAPKDATIGKLFTILHLAFVLAAYGGLIYLVKETRSLVAKQILLR